MSQVATVTIVPDFFCAEDLCPIERGGTAKYKAIVADKDGQELNLPVAWSTGDTTIATVADDGTVTGIAAGDTDLFAKSGGVTGSRSITVAILLDHIEIDPTWATIPMPGATQAFKASAYDSKNVLVPGVSFTWTSTNPLVASFADANQGTATAIGKGLAVIQAATADRAAWATLQVGPSVISKAAPFALVQIASFTSHSCGIDGSGKAYCWGTNEAAELGDPNLLPPDQNRPSPGLVTTAPALASITVGGGFTCGVTPAKSAYCWGDQGSGKLGNGETKGAAVATPTPVLGNHLFTALRGGDSHICGIDDGGHVLCWGGNNDGEIGDGTYDDRSSPTPVMLTGSFTQVVAGLWHSCALRSDGKAFCWGANDLGQLGSGDAVPGGSAMPLEVVGNHSFKSIASSSSHTCGITAQGAVWCWGRNDSQQISTDPNQTITTPVAIDAPNTYSQVAAGAFHTCLRTATGAVRCFGNDDYGQLGNGTLKSATSPVDVLGGLVFTDIEAGSHNMCGITAAGAYCWGAAGFGELGIGFGSSDGDLTPVPWPVAMP